MIELNPTPNILSLERHLMRVARLLQQLKGDSKVFFLKEIMIQLDRALTLFEREI